MTMEWGFTDAIMVFCAIALLFRLESELTALTATVRSGVKARETRHPANGRSDFYCFFHSKALTGR